MDYRKRLQDLLAEGEIFTALKGFPRTFFKEKLDGSLAIFYYNIIWARFFDHNKDWNWKIKTSDILELFNFLEELNPSDLYKFFLNQGINLGFRVDITVDKYFLQDIFNSEGKPIWDLLPNAVKLKFELKI